MTMMTKNKSFWTFNKADSKTGEITIYGPISRNSWWDDVISPKKFKQELDDLGDIETLNLYINSEGGDVFAGQAIHSMLKRHKAKVNTYVDGLAASIASVIALAGDTVTMPNNAMIMIHNPWSIAMGYASEFRKMADDLDKIRESIIAVYEDRSALTRDEIMELMDAETWLTAEDAVEYGFADKIDEEKEVAAALDGGFLVLNNQKMDLSQFKNAPKFVGIQQKQHETQQKEPVTQAYDIHAQLLTLKKRKYQYEEV